MNARPVSMWQCQKCKVLRPDQDTAESCCNNPNTLEANQGGTLQCGCFLCTGKITWDVR